TPARPDTPGANIAHVETTGFAPRLKDAVVDFVDERSEMEGARVPHAPRAFYQHLRLGQIFFRPVHSKSKGVSLMVVRAELLAAQLPFLACHALPRVLSRCLVGQLAM